jgi:hypothetical protein
MDTSETMEQHLMSRQWVRTQLFQWLSKLRSSATSVEDGKGLAHQLTSRTDKNVGRVKELDLKNRRPIISKTDDML